MSIAANATCLQCHLARTLKIVQPLGTDEQTTAFAKELMKLYIRLPEGAPSPWMGPYVEDLLRAKYGLSDDRYRQEKLDSNRFVMERLEWIRGLIHSAADPLFAGLQMAVLGNYLDFAALQGNVHMETLEQLIRGGLDMELDKDCYRALQQDLEAGRKLLYLTDNAGEIVFDRLFLEEIAARYPHLEILVCVRGDTVYNDATRKDAADVGITFPVIDNCSRHAGTIIEALGEEARKALDEADVVIAKGMGNTETMYGCGYNVYYAFLVKCQRFVNRFGKPMFTPMIVKERE